MAKFLYILVAAFCVNACDNNLSVKDNGIDSYVRPDAGEACNEHEHFVNEQGQTCIRDLCADNEQTWCSENGDNVPADNCRGEEFQNEHGQTCFQDICSDNEQTWCMQNPSSPDAEPDMGAADVGVLEDAGKVVDQGFEPDAEEPDAFEPECEQDSDCDEGEGEDACALPRCIEGICELSEDEQIPDCFLCEEHEECDELRHCRDERTLVRHDLCLDNGRCGIRYLECSPAKFCSEEFDACILPEDGCHDGEAFDTCFDGEDNNCDELVDADDPDCEGVCNPRDIDSCGPDFFCNEETWQCEQIVDQTLRVWWTNGNEFSRTFTQDRGPIAEPWEGFPEDVDDLTLIVTCFERINGEEQFFPEASAEFEGHPTDVEQIVGEIPMSQATADRISTCKVIVHGRCDRLVNCWVSPRTVIVDNDWATFTYGWAYAHWVGEGEDNSSLILRPEIEDRRWAPYWHWPNPGTPEEEGQLTMTVQWLPTVGGQLFTPNDGGESEVVPFAGFPEEATGLSIDVQCFEYVDGERRNIPGLSTMLFNRALDVQHLELGIRTTPEQRDRIAGCDVLFWATCGDDPFCGWATPTREEDGIYAFGTVTLEWSDWRNADRQLLPYGEEDNRGIHWHWSNGVQPEPPEEELEEELIVEWDSTDDEYYVQQEDGEDYILQPFDGYPELVTSLNLAVICYDFDLDRNEHHRIFEASETFTEFPVDSRRISVSILMTRETRERISYCDVTLFGQCRENPACWRSPVNNGVNRSAYGQAALGWADWNGEMQLLSYSEENNRHLHWHWHRRNDWHHGQLDVPEPEPEGRVGHTIEVRWTNGPTIDNETGENLDLGPGPDVENVQMEVRCYRRNQDDRWWQNYLRPDNSGYVSLFEPVEDLHELTVEFELEREAAICRVQVVGYNLQDETIWYATTQVYTAGEVEVTDLVNGEELEAVFNEPLPEVGPFEWELEDYAWAFMP